ncbi:MAG TPA: acyl-CoA dehydrogenase family protein [Acidimicrobiales bacterium]|nr:acyl-CoA dehydrogenase family protein [Acidimicrobiales bacterium]
MRSALRDIGLDEDERRFAAEVRGFLAETAPQRDRFQIFKDRGGATAKLYRELGERGWLGLTWPEPLGGLGRPAMYELVLWDEMAYARAARPPVGAGMVARSIVEWGTPEQHDRFLPGIRSGEEAFSLGYSEPEAGSDLTSLRTRARRDGDSYVVTGEKRWTSDAHTADWLWLLCRTGTQEERSAGLTLLVVDLASAGVTVSPIPTLDGHRLNEVRLDDVVVPAANRVGPEGGAWEMIRVALARERHLQVMPGRLERDLESLQRLLDDLPDRGDRHREEHAGLVARALAVRAAVYRSVRAAQHEEITPAVAARNKIVGTTLMQQIARFAARVGGRAAVLRGEDLELLWRESIMETVAGGTTEMMLTVVARHGLRRSLQEEAQ